MKNREGEGELNTQAWVREAKDPLVQRPRGHARIQEHKREDEIHGELEKDSRKKWQLQDSWIMTAVATDNVKKEHMN